MNFHCDSMLFYAFLCVIRLFLFISKSLLFDTLLFYIFFLLLNFHALCLSFSFENTLIDFEFLFRHFDNCLFIDALKHILSYRFFCELC